MKLHELQRQTIFLPEIEIGLPPQGSNRELRTWETGERVEIDVVYSFRERPEA